MARPEVYNVGHDRRDYANFRSQGWSKREAQAILTTRLSEQIPSYLGEFILKVPFKEFHYGEIRDSQTKERGIGAPGFIGDIGESYERAIADAQTRGWSGARERAESAGFNEKLKPQLLDSPEGTFYLWISPPGPKEEGYGDYSFTHIGQIQNTASDRRINVLSIRNTLTLNEHREIINHFLPEGEKLENPKDTDFLRNPVVIANENNASTHDFLVVIDTVLKTKTGHTTRFAKDYQERKDWESRLREALGPMINDYYFSLSSSTPEETQRILWTIENYTQVWTEQQAASTVEERPATVRELEATILYRLYGYEPKALAGGSCPPNLTKSLNSSLFSSAVLPWQEHQLENSHSSEGKKTLECTCPNCNQRVKAVIEDGKIHCPACGASALYEC